MRDVAIVSYSASKCVRADDRNEVEILMPVVNEAVESSGIPKADIGFTVSGSCDYLAGQPFAFVGALDAIGAWPPIEESHVEMDGAWALYEAWVRLQMGDCDSALVYAFGKSSPGDIHRTLAIRLDPYHVQPLWPDQISLAALQARALLDAGRCTERDMADVVARSRRSALTNERAQLSGDLDAGALLDEPYIAEPLRRHDCPPVGDGAAAIVLAAGQLARDVCHRPVWIRGIDHRIEPHSLGARDLTRSVSTEIAGRKAGAREGGVEVAELHAPFSHQEVILRDALGLDGGVKINPSGGVLCGNPIMAGGLSRIGEAATRVYQGAKRALAHATSGPCLQHNLVCVMEASGGFGGGAADPRQRPRSSRQRRTPRAD